MKALSSYSSLEWELATVLRVLLDTTPAKANLIFYRIVNTRARYGIIADLMSINAPDLKAFWGWMERLLQSADTTRNHLTHWLPVLNAEQTVYLLENPVSLMRDLPGALTYGVEEVKAFENECRELTFAVHSLAHFLEAPSANVLPPALIEVFRQPPACRNPQEFRQALFDATRPAPHPPLRV